MNRVTALCLAAVCCLTAGSAARASSISSTGPISYNFTPNTPQIFFNGTFSAVRLMATSGTMPTTTGTIHTNLAAFSFAPSFWKMNVSVPIDLTLSDASGSKTIQVGTLSGQLWHNGSNLQFTPLSPTVKTDFDGHIFKITYNSIQQTSGFGMTSGQLMFTVKDPLVGGGGGATTQGLPEPSSLVLAGIGVPLIGVFLRRRRAAKKNS